MKDKIIAARKKLGLNQEKFGALFFVGKSCVSQWESGTRTPTKRIMEKIESLYEGG